MTGPLAFKRAANGSEPLPCNSANTSKTIYSNTDGGLRICNGSAWTAVGGGSSVAWSAVTGATSTAAYLVGTGGSFGPTGSGVVTANALTGSVATPTFRTSITLDTGTSTDDRIIIQPATGGAARFDLTLQEAEQTGAGHTQTFPSVTGTFITTGNLTDAGIYSSSGLLYLGGAGNSSLIALHTVAIGDSTTGAALTNSGGVTLVGIGAGATLTGVGDNSSYFGYRSGSTSLAARNTAMGADGFFYAFGADNVSVGYANGAGLRSVNCINNVWLGSQVMAGNAGDGAHDVTYIGFKAGYSSPGNETYSIALGSLANPTGSNQLVMGGGGNGLGITSGFFGQGVTSASPEAFTFGVTGGSGSNTAGANAIHAAGISTGSATPASLLFQTSTAAGSSSTPQSLTTRLTISSTLITAALPIATNIGVLIPTQLSSSATTLHIGVGSGAALTNAIDGTYLGNGAGSVNVSAADTTYIGYRAGYQHTGANNTFVGSVTGAQSVSNAGTDNVGVGYGALGNGSFSASTDTAVGSLAGSQLTSGYLDTFIGYSVGAAYIGGSTGVNSIYTTIIGGGAGSTIASPHYSIVIGAAALATNTNQLVLGGGGNGAGITTAFIGQGVKSGGPESVTLSITGGRDGVDTDLAGASFIVAGSLGTGAGAPGSLLFKTSTAVGGGTGAQTLSTRLTISPTLATFTLPIVLPTASPASGAACTAGQFTWDASFLYICTASGAWKRVAVTGGY